MEDKIKIRFMKKEVLNSIKYNLSSYYEKYYKEEDNSWLYEEFGEPFEDYIEVDYFDLYQIEGVEKGKNTLENCKILYENLKMIPENIAIDERLWAGICHDHFYNYIKERFEYNAESFNNIDFNNVSEDELIIIENTINTSENTEDYIGDEDEEVNDKSNNKKKKEKLESVLNKLKSRFFFVSDIKVSLFRHSLAKFWWNGYMTYDENEGNKFEMLDSIGSKDIYSNMTTIFLSYKFPFNKHVLKGITMGFKHFRDNDIRLVAEQVREMMKDINITGGAIMLDVLSQEEIRDMFIKSYENKEHIKRIQKKK